MRDYFIVYLMQTKNKHKKLSIFVLFLVSVIVFRLGMVLSLIPRFNVDVQLDDFVSTNPDAPLPLLMQIEKVTFQSFWFMWFLGLLISLPVTYFLSKKLKFISPIKTTCIILMTVLLILLLTYMNANTPPSLVHYENIIK